MENDKKKEEEQEPQEVKKVKPERIVKKTIQEKFQVSDSAHILME